MESSCERPVIFDFAIIEKTGIEPINLSLKCTVYTLY